MAAGPPVRGEQAPISSFRRKRRGGAGAGGSSAADPGLLLDPEIDQGLRADPLGPRYLRQALRQRLFDGVIPLFGAEVDLELGRLRLRPHLAQIMLVPVFPDLLIGTPLRNGCPSSAHSAL